MLRNRLESRDNPFLPGGDLSKETEELLKKATIVRDKFYLQQEQEKLLQEAEQQAAAVAAAHSDYVPEAYGNSGGDGDAADGTLPNAGVNSPLLEERISPTAVSQENAAAPPPQPRENGKATGDAAASDTSPDKVRLEMGGSSPSPTAADGRGAGGVVVVVDSDADQQDKDKAKRRPKCCLLM